MKNGVSKSMLERIPLYLEELKDRLTQGQETISATAIAKAVGLGEVQVRKDLALISGAGKPKIGYEVSTLLSHIQAFLGTDDVTQAVIVGAGKIGMALLDYAGFEEFGVHICAAFDLTPPAQRDLSFQKPVLALCDFFDYCKQHTVEIGIIAVPAEAAQTVCDDMVAAGLRAIWNFSPATLRTPKNIIVQNERLALSLCKLNLQQKAD